MTVETKTEVGTPAPAVKVDPRQRADAVVVTQENFNEYVGKQLAKPDEVVIEDDANDPDGAAKKELAEIEAKKAAAKGKIRERFSELTGARKAAEAKAAAETTARIAAEQRAEEVAAEAAALKAKYEPPKSDELGPEPQPEQFTDPREFAKALKDWTAQLTLSNEAKKAAETRAKEEGEAVAKKWGERVADAKTRLPDYAERMEAAASVKISDQAREAILRLDVGPEILYHLADPEHPERAPDLTKLSVQDMYIELGRLAAQFSGTLKKSPAAAAAQAATLSKAPPPISPLNGGGSAVVRLTGSDEVPKNLSYDSWKKLRLAGKIQ